MATIDQQTDAEKSPSTSVDLSSLPYKQQLFVREYVANRGNATRAAAAAYDIDTTTDNGYNRASVQGCKLVSNGKVHNAIEKLTEQYHIDSEVRIAQLANIAKGLYSHEVETTTTDKHGRVQSSTRTVSKPKSTDIIKSIDLINRMTGLYQQQEIDADIARKEYEDLRKRHLT